MQAQQVMSGKHGEIWIDGDYMAQVTDFKAEVTVDKAEIKMIKHTGVGYKPNGYKAKGSLKMHKVSSYMIQKLNDDIHSGHSTVCTIIAKLSDPDAIGAERICIKDATFDSLTLADWSVGKNGQESYNFTFSEWDVMDTADE
jgi:hypothetical protein